MNDVNISMRKRPVGIFIFGWLLIVCSIYNMMKYAFGGYTWLCETFNYWPHWLIDFRYVVSWIQRLMQLTAGIGFLSGNKTSRKIAVAVAIFTITTIFWRLDYPAELNHCRKLDQLCGGMFSQLGIENLSFERLCIPSLIIQYMVVSFLGRFALLCNSAFD